MSSAFIYTECDFEIVKNELEMLAVNPVGSGYRSQQCDLAVVGERRYNLSLRVEILKDKNEQLVMQLTYESPHIHFAASVTTCIQSANQSLTTIEPSLVQPGVNGSGQKKLRATICSLSDALDPGKKFIVDGKFVIKMRLAFREKTFKFNTTTLASRLWSRDDRDFVIIVGKEGEAKTLVRVHKLILQCASVVFDRMLESPMKERDEGKMEIVDFGAEVVETAVSFFYEQDTLDGKPFNILLELLRFADKYDIVDLKAKTEYILQFYIFPENVVKIANAALISNADMIKKVCRTMMNVYAERGTFWEEAEMLNDDFET